MELIKGFGCTDLENFELLYKDEFDTARTIVSLPHRCPPPQYFGPQLAI